MRVLLTIATSERSEIPHQLSLSLCYRISKVQLNNFRIFFILKGSFEMVLHLL